MAHPGPSALSSEPWEERNLGTNEAAGVSLNLIACLAMAPEALGGIWEKRQT